MRSLQLVLAIFLVLGSSLAVHARNPQGPAVNAIISVRSFDAFRRGLVYLARISGEPAAVATFDGMLSSFTRGKGLQGLDTTRPFGVAFVSPGGTDSLPLAFVPVADQDKFTRLLHGLGRGVPLIGGQPHKLSERWFLVGPALRQLSGPAPDPDRVVSRLAREYDVAFSAKFGQLPWPLKQRILGTLDQYAALASARRRGDSASEAAGRKAGAQMARWAFQQFLDDAEEVVFGLRLSPQARKLVLDLSIVARQGSDLAVMTRSLTRGSGRFGKLVDTSSFGGLAVSVSLSGESKQALLSLFPSTGKRGSAGMLASRSGGVSGSAGLSRGLSEFLEGMRKTVETGAVDISVVVRGIPPGPLALVGGARLANPRDIESWFQKYARSARQSGESLGFELNKAKYRGARIHEFRPRISDDDLKASFGHEAKIHLAFTRQSGYVAFGGDSLGAVKWALDRVEGRQLLPGSGSPIVFETNVGSWLDIFSAVEPELAGLRAYLTGGDRFRVRVERIPNGQRVRVELEEGILRLLWAQVAQKGRAHRLR